MASDRRIQVRTTFAGVITGEGKKLICLFSSLFLAEILGRKQALEAVGARIFECRTVRGDDGRDHVDMIDAFRVAKQNGINSIMVEGGAAILTSCLQEAAQRHFIDLVVVTVAPTFIGGLRAVSGLLAPSSATPSPPASTFPRLQQPHYHVLGEDLVILGRLDH
ncbi:hypothetical protein ON010_g13562 [Phytophthora cinnamomi]|nr:hypothetical protein ON010_g13562 [Phytophthora cinnamomi]